MIGDGYVYIRWKFANDKSGLKTPYYQYMVKKPRASEITYAIASILQTCYRNAILWVVDDFNKMIYCKVFYVPKMASCGARMEEE